MSEQIRFSDVPTVKLQAHFDGYEYHTLMPTEFPDAIVMANDGDIFDGSYVSKRYVQQRTCSDVGNPGIFSCSACGATLTVGAENQTDETVRYCPSCGAEVVM
jgi:DNA-directed RNA polymerase subunit RPC12/RpoP